MKKILAVIAITAITFSATAQEKRESNRKHNMEQGKHKKGKQPGKQMMKELNFSEAQQSQMKADRLAYKAKMEQLKQNQHISVKEFNEKKEVLRREHKAKMESILTPEQKAKMAVLKAGNEQKKLERQNKRLEKMKTALSLSNDQAFKIKAQNEATYTKLKAIKENETLSKDEKKQQMKTVKEISKEERKNILSAAQIKKMEEIKVNRKQKDFKQIKK